MKKNPGLSLKVDFSNFINWPGFGITFFEFNFPIIRIEFSNSAMHKISLSFFDHSTNLPFGETLRQLT